MHGVERGEEHLHGVKHFGVEEADRLGAIDRIVGRRCGWIVDRFPEKDR
jgi:hypothetical protein